MAKNRKLKLKTHPFMKGEKGERGGSNYVILVLLDRWSSYTVTTVWGFVWVDSALVLLGEWSSYRSSRLNRFVCIF